MHMLIDHPAPTGERQDGEQGGDEKTAVPGADGKPSGNAAADERSRDTQAARRPANHGILATKQEGQRRQRAHNYAANSKSQHVPGAYVFWFHGIDAGGSGCAILRCFAPPPPAKLAQCLRPEASQPDDTKEPFQPAQPFWPFDIKCREAKSPRDDGARDEKSTNFRIRAFWNWFSTAWHFVDVV